MSEVCSRLLVTLRSKGKGVVGTAHSTALAVDAPVLFPRYFCETVNNAIVVF